MKQLTIGHPSDIGQSEAITDVDLWIESAQVQRSVSCQTTFRHVKGHHDNFIIKGGKEGLLN